MALSLRTLIAIGVVFALTACESAEERAQNHLAGGQALLEAGDPARAVLEFRNALRLDDQLVDAHFGLADAALAQQDVRTAFANLQRVTELEPENVRALESLAQLLLAANQVEQALDLSVRALELAPDKPSTLALRAAIAMRLDDLELAEELAGKALEIEPADLEALGVLAALRLRDGRVREALVELEKGLQGDPGNIPFSLMRIAAFERLGDDQSVGEALKALVEQNPENAGLVRQLARWQLQQGEQDAAIDTFRRFAAREEATVPERIGVIEFIGQVKGLEVARAALQEYLDAENDPEEKLVYQSAMAELDSARGDLDAAVTNLRAALADVEDSPTALSARLTLASLLFARGETEQSLAIINEVIAADPNSVPALGLRGRIAFSRGDYGAAIIDLRAALAQEPENTKVLLLLAEAHQKSGNADLAGDRMAEAARASGYAPTPSLAYAQFLRRTQELDGAERVIQQALANAPAHGDLLRALAQLRLEKGDWVGAEVVAESLRQLAADGASADANSRTATEIQALAASGRGEFEASINILESMHAEAPLTGPSLAGLIQTYLLAERTDEAIGFLEKIIAEDPNNGEALVLLGSLQRNGGQVDKARSSFDKAIRVAPENERAYSQRAAMFLADGEPEEARRIAERGLEASPESTEIRMMLAQSLEILGEVEEAITQYELLYTARPQSLVIANNLASLLADNRDDEASLNRAFEMARGLQSVSLPHFQDTYGWLLHRLGSSRDAVPILEKAAEALPNEAVVQYHLAAARAGVGQVDAARAGLIRVIDDARANPSVVARATELLEQLETSETPQSLE
ncbi:MAG: tetratricopeptide repeat protein [Pseudomonadota bacterium]